MRSHVRLHQRGRYERLLADPALVRPVAGVVPKMDSERAFLREALLANFTTIRLLLGVHALVNAQNNFLIEALPASVAHERLLSRMKPHMIGETAARVDRLAANFAHVADVHVHLVLMGQHAGLALVLLAAIRALEVLANVVLVVRFHVPLVVALVEKDGVAHGAHEAKTFVLHVEVLLALELGVEAFAALRAVGAVVLRVPSVVEGQGLFVRETFAAEVADELVGGLAVASGHVALDVVLALELLLAYWARVRAVAVHHHVAREELSLRVRFVANLARYRPRLGPRFRPGKKRSPLFSTLF